MARIPHGAELIANNVSIAPGFMLENVIVMAGVPAIMEVMLKDATQHLRTGPKVNSVSIVVERPEADIAELFADHQKAYPDVVMGSYPTFNDGRYRTELVLRSTDQTQLDQAARTLADELLNRRLL
jgi:molybdopterin-biosynthesis enzyme MoeA-like protein